MSSTPAASYSDEIDDATDELAAVLQKIRRLADVVSGPPLARPPGVLELAQSIYRQRRARVRAFGLDSDLFQEAPWDILLDLFIAHEHGKQVTVSSACIGACVPSTTALRWLRLLEERGYLRHWRDEKDRRCRFVELTPGAIETMRRYLILCMSE